MLWRKGVSTPGVVPSHADMNYNNDRLQLLRLMVVCLSQPLYYNAEDYLKILNPFCSYFTCKRTKNIKNLFISLLNTVISYDTQGMGLPYLSSVNEVGVSEALVDLSLHIILILIEYKPPTKENLVYLVKGGYISI